MWTKIAKEALASNTIPTSRIETGKKRPQARETQDGSKKKSRAGAKEIESKTVEANDHPY